VRYTVDTDTSRRKTDRDRDRDRKRERERERERERDVCVATLIIEWWKRHNREGGGDTDVKGETGTRGTIVRTRSLDVKFVTNFLDDEYTVYVIRYTG